MARTTKLALLFHGWINKQRSQNQEWINFPDYRHQNIATHKIFPNGNNHCSLFVTKIKNEWIVYILVEGARI
jgi:hypothetical protein